MASNAFHIKPLTLATTLVWVIGVEAMAWWGFRTTALPHLALLGLVRMIQIAGMIGIVIALQGGLNAMGWAPVSWPAGLKKGAIWALCFGLAAAAGMGILYLSGRNPLAPLHMKLPQNKRDLWLFFLVGGFIGPVAEEILFRGVLYSFFRRWGIVIAIAASTAVFVALHAVHGIPVTQIVGGLVFALAFETSRNLMVPIAIHVTGNIALFALSLPIFRL